MSILDGLPRSEDEIIEASHYSRIVVDAFLAGNTVPPTVQTAFALMKKGVPLSTLLDITDKECDALFVQACRDVQFGEIERARQSLMMLHLMQPLESKIVYVLAAGYQVQGDYATAGKLYVHALARDATNPDGYLRLGECFLANKEFDMALNTFERARDLAHHGSAPDKARATAQHLIALTQSQRDGSPV